MFTASRMARFTYLNFSGKQPFQTENILKAIESYKIKSFVINNLINFKMTVQNAYIQCKIKYEYMDYQSVCQLFSL